MMFGITSPDFLRFLMQFCAAVAGAASFWGLILTILSLKYGDKDSEKSPAFYKLSSILMFVFGLFFIGFIFFWWFGLSFVFVPFSIAHEGIKINPIDSNIIWGFILNSVPVVVLSIFSVISLYFWKFKNLLFKKWSPLFFLVQFVFLSFILSFSVSTESLLSKHQTFFSFHNFHSIFTLGSVIIVDILYLTTFKNDGLKKILYSFFPWISMAIWIGLGLDFLSVGFIFKESFKLTSQFLFSQTAVGVIILNGLLLSERLNDVLISISKKGGSLLLPPKLQKIAAVSGAVSVISWVSITFVDFFELTLNYLSLISVYILAIICFYFLEPIFAGFLNMIFVKVSPVEEF